jgi:hypothetical protein
MAESAPELRQALERLRRRRRAYWALLSLVLVGLFIVFQVPTQWSTAAPLIYVFAGGALIAYVDLLMRQLQCPRCHQSFFRQSAYWARRCANCGLTV